jgi:hypothetical protein
MLPRFFPTSLSPEKLPRRIKRHGAEVVPRAGAAADWCVSPSLGWQDLPTRPKNTILTDFSQFCGIGTALELYLASTRDKGRAKKGSFQMSSQSQFKQTLLAAVAAVLMSTVAVGAAVGPAQAVASPVGYTLHA